MRKLIAPKDRSPGLATTKITNEINKDLRELNAIVETGQVDEFWGGAGAATKFIKVASAWTSGNTMTGEQWSAQTGGSATGTGQVTIDLTSPNAGAPPTNVSIAANDIIAYTEYADQSSTSKGLAIAVKQGATGTIPAPHAKYEVLQCTAFTSSTVYTVAFDRVRCGP